MEYLYLYSKAEIYNKYFRHVVFEGCSLVLECDMLMGIRHL